MHPSKAGIYREKCILSTLLCNLSFSCRYIFKAHVTENNHNESKRQTFIVFTNIYPTLLFRTEIGTLAYCHISTLLYDKIRRNNKKLRFLGVWSRSFFVFFFPFPSHILIPLCIFHIFSCYKVHCNDNAKSNH